MSAELLNHPYAKTIWNLLNGVIQNEYGTAALMGNLRAESGLYPDRVQGDVPYSSYSQEYTAQVDSGDISEYDFVYNGPGGGGYGLAQWTFSTRKQALYDKYIDQEYPSIGDVELGCAFLIQELVRDFPDVMKALQNATNIRKPSNTVLHDFEAPADQSESVEELREQLGKEVYDTFGSYAPDEPDEPTTPGNHKRLSKLLLLAVATDSI